ncbi:MAG TPA: hypothetical protein VGL81_28405 [Polyangiaceae bacterium]
MKSKSLLGAAMFALASLVVSSTAFAQDPSQSDSPSRKDDPPPPRDTDAAHHDGSAHVGLLGGVGFPRPLAIEGVIEFDRLILLGAEYSALPTVNFSGVDTSMWALAADARVFPFRNGFFIGLRAGKQHLGETASLTVSGVTASASNTADTTFLNPRLGFLWNWHALAIGIDAGVQIPVLTSTASTVPAGVSPPSGAADLTHTLSQSVIPTVDLLRIGVVM